MEVYCYLRHYLLLPKKACLNSYCTCVVSKLPTCDSLIRSAPGRFKGFKFHVYLCCLVNLTLSVVTTIIQTGETCNKVVYTMKVKQHNQKAWDKTSSVKFCFVLSHVLFFYLDTPRVFWTFSGAVNLGWFLYTLNICINVKYRLFTLYNYV